MKAAVQHIYGPPSVLQVKEVPQPGIREHELLVRVYATTVNRTDCAMVQAKPFIMRFFTGLVRPSRPTPGTDFAGQVVAVGSQVSHFKVGDQVFGFNDQGLCSQAQYLRISQDGPLALMPTHATYQQAAATLEGAHYAYNFLNKVPLSSGMRVLVNGASGAIGSAMVQLLKYHGIQVTAVCGTPNLALIQSIGADEVIDYLKEDFTQQQQRYHYVFDAVGKSSFWRCRRLLEPRGIYISSELGWMAQNPILTLISPLFGGKKVKFPLPLDCKRTVLFIQKLMEAGQFKAVIDREYPLEDVVEAYTYVETGQKTGNVVLVMN